MPVLIIPDIHERLDKLATALHGRVQKADRVVFLGDYFDAFGPVDLGRVAQVCAFINGSIDGLTPMITDSETRHVPVDFLLGNHDCHYFFRHMGFRCSGFDHQKWEVINANVPQGIIDKFKVFTKVGPYLLSHAGLHEATLGFDAPLVEAAALRTAREGGWDPFWGAGQARGGRQRIGGPTWLDWNYEFEHIDGMPQIVGHTNGKTVRMKGRTTAESATDEDGTVTVPVELSYCLDTALHDVAWVDEETGVVTIEHLDHRA